jgi:NOL1/NOP2/fmu family ribosome biogenesis protein
MTFKFIKSSERKKILAGLEEVYGITKLDYVLIEGGRKRLRDFTGNLPKEEIAQLAELVNVEVVGMYLVSRRDGDLRLSFDAIPLFRNQITKRIVEIDKKQLDLWIRGHDLEIPCEPGLTVMKFSDYFVGMGKSSGTKIFNYVPKERKLKTPLPKL